VRDDQPFISVIVPAYQASRTLADTLESLAALTYPAHEVIVVDDGSTDDTLRIAREYPVRIIRLERNSGAGVARNTGAAEARGQLLAFTDADVIVPPDWLERGLALMQETGAVVVSGPFAGSATDSFIGKFCYHWLRNREITRRKEVGVATCANMLVRTDVFRQAGGFPIFGLGRRPSRAFQGHEDANWAYLLTRDAASGVIVWEPSFGVVHCFRDSLWSLLKQQWFIARIGVVSHVRYPDMLTVPSNFKKTNTLIHLVALGAGTAGLALLLPAGLVFPPALAGAGACAAAIVGSMLGHVPFFREVYRQERSLSFTCRAAATLYLNYLAMDAGILTALLQLCAAGFQFSEDVPEPSYELEEPGPHLSGVGA